MKPMAISAAILAAAVFGISSTALAAGKTDAGKKEYDDNCSACHGAKGKGDGPIAGEMKTKVPDLTVLAKNNGGVFPTTRVYEVIDGRQEVKAHGWRDMPVWGNEYATRGGGASDDYPYDREAFARGRILLLIDYLYRIQAK